MKRALVVVFAVTVMLNAAAAVAGIVDNGDGTATDSSTKLMWQRKDDAILRNWDQAVAYCATLTLGGRSQWRLPNITELRSIMEAAKKRPPKINSTLFPATVPAPYWTSSSYAEDIPLAWHLNFSSGAMGSDSKEEGKHYVRCVR